jgi:hypothetical protein
MRAFFVQRRLCGFAAEKMVKCTTSALKRTHMHAHSCRCVHENTCAHAGWWLEVHLYCCAARNTAHLAAPLHIAALEQPRDKPRRKEVARSRRVQHVRNRHRCYMLLPASPDARYTAMPTESDDRELTVLRDEFLDFVDRLEVTRLKLATA